MTEEEFFEWLQNAVQAGAFNNQSAGTSTESPSAKGGNGPKSSGGSSSSGNKRKKKGLIFSRMQNKEKKEKYMYRSFWAMERTKEKKSAFERTNRQKRRRHP